MAALLDTLVRDVARSAALVPVHLNVRCLILGFNGAISTLELRDALWAKITTGAPRRQRRSAERYSIVQESLLVGVGLDQAGIDREAVAADEPLRDAAPDGRLEQLPQKIALAETTMPVVRDGDRASHGA